MTQEHPPSWRDTRPASWARTVARLRRNAEELRSYDFEIREPDSLETPPERRTGDTSNSQL